MTKTKTFITVAILLVCVSIFGAWASADGGETRYADSMLMSAYSSVTVNYSTRDLTGPVTTYGECPFYYPVSGLTNACGAVAGTEIVAFYDRYFTDLIPNWTPYYSASPRYKMQDTTYVPAVMKEMYSLMRTNVDDVGVSETDFLNGLTKYFNNKGRKISYQSVMSGGTLDYAKCKAAVSNNKPIVLFTTPTSVYTVSSVDKRDTISTINISGAHIMVIYGYCEVKYYNASGSLIRYDEYLNVAMGQVGYTFEFYRPNNTATQAAYIVNVS